MGGREEDFEGGNDEMREGRREEGWKEGVSKYEVYR